MLYSGTAYNFLGSEPIISRYSPTQSLLRTEYSTSWLNGELNELNDCQAVGRIAFKNVFWRLRKHLVEMSPECHWLMLMDLDWSNPFFAAVYWPVVAASLSHMYFVGWQNTSTTTPRKKKTSFLLLIRGRVENTAVLLTTRLPICDCVTDQSWVGLKPVKYQPVMLPC